MGSLPAEVHGVPWPGEGHQEPTTCQREPETGSAQTRESLSVSLIVYSVFSVCDLLPVLCVFSGCGNQNFAWRTECNQCKAPRPEGMAPPAGNTH